MGVNPVSGKNPFAIGGPVPPSSAPDEHGAASAGDAPLVHDHIASKLHDHGSGTPPAGFIPSSLRAPDPKDHEGRSADELVVKVAELTKRDEDKMSEELGQLASNGDISPGEASQIMALSPIMRRRVLSAIMNGHRLDKISQHAREAALAPGAPGSASALAAAAAPSASAGSAGSGA